MYNSCLILSGIIEILLIISLIVLVFKTGSFLELSAKIDALNCIKSLELAFKNSSISSMLKHSLLVHFLNFLSTSRNLFFKISRLYSKLFLVRLWSFYNKTSKITYITSDNENHTIEVQNGLTVMEGAVQNDIPGIDADCGGGMACTTCRVYVNEDWFDKIKQKEDGEEDMLDMAFEPKKNSRLSCQITVSDELDGLTINIPSKQG